MCGIFGAFSSTKNLNKVSSNKKQIIKTIERRGPDKTTLVKGKNFIAIHSLLSMTGSRIQPIITDKLLLIFNGEIYNDVGKYNSYYNDADLIVKKILEKGNSGFCDLDGEFAICILLFDSNKLLLATDPFGTKPIYYQLTKNSCLVGSYESTIKNSGIEGNIVQIPANTLVEIDLSYYRINNMQKIKPFNFSNQNKKSFKAWNTAFQKSLIKRTASRHKSFVSLSSGHDSGVIAAELINLKIPFYAYIMTYLEDIDIINQRIKILKKNKITFEIISPSKQKWNSMKAFVKRHIDSYKLINPESTFQNYDDPNIHKIPGTISASLINQIARKEGRLISLSGQGGDEIFADYYNEFTYSRMSELKGNWHGVKSPWKNFSGGWNRVFLGSSERISGLFGIESRYPLLDFTVVQEFLNLHPDLKSKYYKAPITNRLMELKFPFHLKKFGFAGYQDESLSTKPATP